MPLNSKVAPLFSGRSMLAINGLIESLRNRYPEIAQALTSIQSSVQQIENALRQNSTVEQLSVVDPDGQVLANIGSFIIGNAFYSGAAFSHLWVGPNADPSTAPFYSDGSNVIIGKNGTVSVRDIGDNEVAWIGVQTETAKVITAATNTSPTVITLNAHGYVNGDTLLIAGATGNTNINGYRIVANSTLNTFEITDLAGVAINGNGALGGSPTATRYYGGILTQTFAIGTDFANYKLRAFANGDLKIRNARIELSGGGSTIVLDPTTGAITVTDDGTGAFVKISAGQVLMGNPSTDNQTTQDAGFYSAYAEGLTSLALASAIFQVFGYCGTGGFGPILRLTHANGTDASVSNTLLNDVLGGVLLSGTNSGGSTSPQAAGVYGVATENFVGSAMGAKLVFNITPVGTNSAVLGAEINENGVNSAGNYQVGGTRVVTARQADPGTAAASPSISTSTITGTAGGTYTATEQGMINALKGDVNFLNVDVANLKTEVDNLITDRDRLRTILQTHGLMA